MRQHRHRNRARRRAIKALARRLGLREHMSARDLCSAARAVAATIAAGAPLAALWSPTLLANDGPRRSKGLLALVGVIEKGKRIGVGP